MSDSDFPFDSVLNLAPLIEYWEVNLDSNILFSGFPAEDIKRMINEAPELREPVEDLAVLEKHKILVGLLLSAVFPTAMLESDLSAAMVPFSFKNIYATPGYLDIMPTDEVSDNVSVNFADNNIRAAKVMMACVFILNKLYGTDFTIDRPMLVTVPDESSGLLRIYKVNINTQFIDVVSRGELKPIKKKIIRMLLDDLYNTELWLKYIDPKQFQFQGFGIIKLVDVTVEEMLSSIKFDLLKKDAVTCDRSFRSMQSKMRAIFRLPDMKLGLSYFDPNENIISNYGARDWSSFVMPNTTDTLTCDVFMGSIYEEAYLKKRPVVVEDLNEYENKGTLEQQLLDNNIKSMVIAPLLHDDEVIGMLELGASEAGRLNPMNTVKIENVIPMFTAAVRRVLGEMQTEVRAVIQEECTSIHPTVEWRFMEEGYDLMSKRRQGIKAQLGDIIFPEVYPIYGLSDIRNSSTERARAIQQDLINNLKEIEKVISAIIQRTHMPILDEINYRVNLEIEKIAGGLDSGDESSVLDFIKEEVMPTFRHFKNSDSELKAIIDEYEKLIDPKLGVIYDKRKDFEESLTAINEAISVYLDHVEQQAQNIFPHYFEKYKTDGVEYNIYIGQSLVKGKKFDSILLRNFRLWQLLTQCEIARNVERLKSELPMELNITQLILVHGESLSIKFRKDEKQFDVDGAYNIRYEIVKKRIDKAYIKGRNERLTQPGKIAIVYTQPKELEEYMRYINYLQAINYLNDSVEELELEELQGASGLRALRVEVNLQAVTRDVGSKLLEEAIAAIHA